MVLPDCFIILYLFRIEGKVILKSISTQTLPLHFWKWKWYQEVKDKHRRNKICFQDIHCLCFRPRPLIFIRLYDNKAMCSIAKSWNLFKLICYYWSVVCTGNKNALEDLIDCLYFGCKWEFCIVCRRLNFVNIFGVTGLTFSNLLSLLWS